MNCRLLSSLLVSLLSSGLGTGGLQAEEPAWLGVALPSPDMNRPESIYRTGAFPPMPVQPSQGRKASADIKGAEIFGYVRDLAAISEQTRKAGEPLWGRIPGRLGDRLATRYIQSRFDKFGLREVRIDEVPMPPVWWPSAWQVTLLGNPAYGAATRDYVFQTAMPQPPSRSTRSGGADAELIYAGYGRDADLIGKDLKNKVAVIRARPLPGAFSSGDGVAQKLAARGAVGLIAIMDWAVDLQLYLDLLLLGTEQMTVFAVSDAEGRFLEDVLTAAEGVAQPRVRIELESEMSTDLRTHNVVGMVRGSDNEYVIVNAHHDAYFYGANDNASGIGTLLALARHLASRQTPPRHNYIFVATGSHHNGHAGATYFIENNQEILDRCLIVLNAEHTASLLEIEYPRLKAAWGSEGGVLVANTETPKFMSLLPENPILLDLFRDAVHRYGVTTLSEVWTAAPGDASTYHRAGYPVVQLIEVGKWYHTTADIPAAVSVPGLERTARAFADFLAELDKRSREEIWGPSETHR